MSLVKRSARIACSGLPQRQAMGLLTMMAIACVGVNVPPAIAQQVEEQAIELTENASGEIQPVTIDDRLDDSSETLDNGSYYDSYTFAGQAGQAIVIDMTSSDFRFV